MISFEKEEVFLITGASSGIGKAIALLLNKLGATVIAIARREEKLKEAHREADYLENFHIEVKDLSQDIDLLPQYVTNLRKKYGKFQGMACCAGISIVNPLRALSYEDHRRMFDINYYSPIYMAKGMVDKRNNNGQGTSLIFISSIGASSCDAGMTAYAGSKNALNASVKSIAREVGRNGIRLNCVSPALIETDMIDDISREFFTGKYPFGFGEVSDVTNFAVFMLSDQSKWISTQNYIIDCGSV